MPMKSGFVDVEGASLYFEDDGQGPPLVFIHAGVADLRMWDEQVSGLGSDFRCIRFDQRGFGRTRNSADSFSPASDLNAVLDHLEVEQAHLVGNSLGGMVAIDFALQHPLRVSSLALVASGLGGWKSEAAGEEIPLEEEMDALEKAQEWDRLVEMDLRLWLDGPTQPQGRVTGEVRSKMREMCRGAYGRDEPEAQKIPLDPPAVDRLTEIQAPALVMVGSQDLLTIRELAGHLVANLKNATLSPYEGVAHMISLEQPARFNGELRMFLQINPLVPSP